MGRCAERARRKGAGEGPPAIGLRASAPGNQIQLRERGQSLGGLPTVRTAFARERVQIEHARPEHRRQQPAGKFCHPMGVVGKGVVDDVFAAPMPPREVGASRKAPAAGFVMRHHAESGPYGCGSPSTLNQHKRRNSASPEPLNDRSGRPAAPARTKDGRKTRRAPQGRPPVLLACRLKARRSGPSDKRSPAPGSRLRSS